MFWVGDDDVRHWINMAWERINSLRPPSSVDFSVSPSDLRRSRVFTHLARMSSVKEQLVDPILRSRVRGPSAAARVQAETSPYAPDGHRARDLRDLRTRTYGPP